MTTHTPTLNMKRMNHIRTFFEHTQLNKDMRSECENVSSQTHKQPKNNLFTSVLNTLHINKTED